MDTSPFWLSKKVLITGAGGFIGSHLCSSLVRSGATVTAMLRYTSRSDWGNLEYLTDEERGNLNVVKGSIEDESFVRSQVKGKEIVFHLAALIGIPYSYEAPSSYVGTNIAGTLNVLQSALDHGTSKVIHTSTSESYGTAEYVPMDEKHPLKAQSPYSASKISADKIAESFFCSFDLPVCTVRPFNTFGPRQSARAVIPTIIAQALTSESIRLGSLAPVRDFTYVEDTVSGFLKAVEVTNSSGEVINLGSGFGISVIDIAKEVSSLIGKKHSILSDETRIRPEASEVHQLLCDNSKAKTLLGWEPEIGFKEGLKRTIDFVSNNIAFYKPFEYAV